MKKNNYIKPQIEVQCIATATIIAESTTREQYSKQGAEFWDTDFDAEDEEEY